MGSGIGKMQKVELFEIQIGDSGGSLLQTVQNDVQSERPIKCFSWRQHEDIENSDGGETHPKRTFFAPISYLG
jgi:hypothetical protein